MRFFEKWCAAQWPQWFLWIVPACLIVIVPVKFWLLFKKLDDGVQLTGLLCWFNVPQESASGPSKTSLLG